MPQILRVHYKRYAVPKDLLSAETCEIEINCCSSVVPVPIYDNTDDCSFNWWHNPDPPEGCTFDPNNPPSWWLQELHDRAQLICSTFGNSIYCAIELAAQWGLDHPGVDPCTDPGGLLYCSAWTNYILPLWANVGEAETIKHCIGGSVDIGIDSNQGLIRFRERVVRLPRGSRFIDEECIDVPLGEDCQCQSPPQE